MSHLQSSPTSLTTSATTPSSPLSTTFNSSNNNKQFFTIEDFDRQILQDALRKIPPIPAFKRARDAFDQVGIETITLFYLYKDEVYKTTDEQAIAQKVIALTTTAYELICKTKYENDIILFIIALEWPNIEALKHVSLEDITKKLSTEYNHNTIDITPAVLSIISPYLALTAPNDPVVECVVNDDQPPPPYAMSDWDATKQEPSTPKEEFEVAVCYAPPRPIVTVNIPATQSSTTPQQSTTQSSTIPHPLPGLIPSNRSTTSSQNQQNNSSQSPPLTTSLTRSTWRSIASTTYKSKDQSSTISILNNHLTPAGVKQIEIVLNKFLWDKKANQWEYTTTGTSGRQYKFTCKTNTAGFWEWDNWVHCSLFVKM